jgi:hypothetical protein
MLWVNQSILKRQSGSERLSAVLGLSPNEPTADYQGYGGDSGRTNQRHQSEATPAAMAMESSTEQAEVGPSNNLVSVPGEPGQLGWRWWSGSMPEMGNWLVVCSGGVRGSVRQRVGPA